jgi:uncharacterized protein YifN (PemK superfamily)
MAIADVVEMAELPESVYVRSDVDRILVRSGFSGAVAAALGESLRHCFQSERFGSWFARTRLKTDLVRARLTAASAEHFLRAIEPCVVNRLRPPPRVPIVYTPSPGRVVMCDFSYLSRPEMQKERRAVVISSRRRVNYGRCTLVPVTASRARDDNPYYHEFAAGSYRFFHPSKPVWAVCDHVYTVSLKRLAKVMIDNMPILPALSQEDLRAIRRLVGAALGTVLTERGGDATS